MQCGLRYSVRHVAVAVLVVVVVVSRCTSDAENPKVRHAFESVILR